MGRTKNLQTAATSWGARLIVNGVAKIKHWLRQPLARLLELYEPVLGESEQTHRRHSGWRISYCRTCRDAAGTCELRDRIGKSDAVLDWKLDQYAHHDGHSEPILSGAVRGNYLLVIVL